MIRRFIRFIVILGLSLALIFSIQFYHFLYTPLQVPKEGYIFVVAPGTSVQKIGLQLVKKGIISFRPWFLLCVYQEQAWSKLKAGEYLIKSGSTPLDLVHQLRDGKVIQYALTIVPGWTFERLLLEVHQSPHLVHTLTGLKAEEIMEKLGYAGEHPEGQFLPETYYFPAGTSDVVFLKRAYDFLHEKLALLWNEPRDTTFPLKSSYEALILASIIEKESSIAEEYTEIAGVYIRRLMKNMPLQADPTVIYGVGKNYMGNLTRQMLQDPTPYNTYQQLGLPPTPIALSSYKALEAAVHPKAGESLYFVAKGEGKGHIFSNTLAEHQIAVTQYRKALTGTQ